MENSFFPSLEQHHLKQVVTTFCLYPIVSDTPGCDITKIWTTGPLFRILTSGISTKHKAVLSATLNAFFCYSGDVRTRQFLCPWLARLLMPAPVLLQGSPEARRWCGLETLRQQVNQAKQPWRSGYHIILESDPLSSMWFHGIYGWRINTDAFMAGFLQAPAKES